MTNLEILKKMKSKALKRPMPGTKIGFDNKKRQNVSIDLNDIANACSKQQKNKTKEYKALSEPESEVTQCSREEYTDVFNTESQPPEEDTERISFERRRYAYVPETQFEDQINGATTRTLEVQTDVSNYDTRLLESILEVVCQIKVCRPIKKGGNRPFHYSFVSF